MKMGFLMRLHSGHELMRFGLANFEEAMTSAEIYEKSIAKYSEEPVAPSVISIGEMKKRFNDLSLSFPDGQSQQFYDDKSDDYTMTQYVISETIAGAIKEALNQARDPKLFEIRFLPIINQLVEGFSDVLDLTRFTIEDAKDQFQQYYRQIGTSSLYSYELVDEQDATDKVKSASIRAANNYQGQFNHLPKVIENKILLQYAAKLSRQFVKRKQYPKKVRS